MNRMLTALALVALCSTSFAVTSFELPWMNHAVKGTNYKSADHPNGIFVVEAYFLNCPYCNTNAPNVDDLADSYANEPRVQVLDVGVDRSDSQYQTWISKHRPNHPVLKDANRTLIRQLGTTGYPSTYIVDCKGTVHYQTSGVWGAAAKAALKDTIDELLTTTCTTEE